MQKISPTPNQSAKTLKPKKSTQLKTLLQSPELQFIMEAHNGVSARIVEEAGFKGIWASGLAVSAQYGVRDNNEASWTQIVEMLEFMSDVTQIPILLDGDTGYGNFNNMRRLVRKLEQREIAGVCIEDKLFPKTNSFINGEKQPLADIEEFCGKIKAGKDSQLDEDFCIVARIEALIAGWDLSEALRRGEAYHAAGADAILIHSKSSRPDEIITFAKEWANRIPLVIVPTKYYSTRTEVFRQAGISLIIWANHMIRAAVASMEAIAREVQVSETLVNIEEKIAPIKEIFRLQGAEELLEAEKRYFGDSKNHSNAIILAATRGEELHGLTLDKPKVMLPIAGKPLLRHVVDKFKKLNISDISLVAGYKAETIDVPGIKIIHNPEYATTGELASLVAAKNQFSDDMLVTYGDLLFRSYILRDLLESSGEIITVVDSAMKNKSNSGSPDYAYCSQADELSLFGQDVNLLKISKNQQMESNKNYSKSHGRWIGMLRCQGQGKQWIEAALCQLQTQPEFNKMNLADLCNHLISQGKTIKVLYIRGNWLDINSLDDLDLAFQLNG
ncbi:phosphoenolpyruvate mutase [Calothrix sp. UHCC 0171]|uniref:phosphoenolpyruvate mutase n=1 Tax=Calothrix sp. UHCC 0171 TaxID=3110245 RepID=UPI002B21C4BD|nr:phosphoenolpyruvate mutase [Calothrix sp. UHCC 0171]MEA5571740.1 phosphoenolpyruvate mutase [Calothrix sp. UHCC 0171]